MKRILIVDDNEVIATVFRNKFVRRGFLVEIAADGLEGLNKIESWTPDLVLLDLMMPNIDGLSLLRKIRATPKDANLPVIVYSNSFTQSAQEEALELGVTRMLSKSETRPNQLMEIVEDVLGTKKIMPPPNSELGDRDVCLKSALDIAAEMRPLLKEYFATDKVSILVTLQHKAYSFTSNAWTAGLQRAALIGEALEALLKTLVNRPDYVSFSTHKTLLQGIECLGSLASAENVDEELLSIPQVLIVDDQELSVMAATRAVTKAKMRSFATVEPLEALRVLQAHTVDLIILDIDMPDMDGNSLCQQLRRIPWHEKTPVIFFSRLAEIQDRMNAATVGGSDFIAKPFLTIELAVKALVWVWKPKEAKSTV